MRAVGIKKFIDNRLAGYHGKAKLEQLHELLDWSKSADDIIGEYTAICLEKAVQAGKEIGIPEEAVLQAVDSDGVVG
jgi:hypothetical protein